MKNRSPFRLIKGISALAIWSIIGLGWAHAQTTDPDMTAQIPFKFTVANTTLPAGKYIIKRVDDNDPQALELHSADGRATVVFLTESAQSKGTPAKSELVFNKYGNRYFLGEIWSQGDSTGNQVEKSRAERRLENNGDTRERHSVEYHRGKQHAKS
jgi:hypothetical protein